MAPTYTPGDSYPVLPVPGLTDPTRTYGSSFGDSFHAPAVLELLFSTDGYTQRGAMLAGGQGVIPTGTVLAQYTSGANQYLYAPYGGSGASNGLNVPLGFLRNGVDTGGASSPAGIPAQPVLGILVYRGIVNYAVTSGLDTNAQGLLNGRVDNAIGAFSF